MMNEAANIVCGQQSKNRKTTMTMMMIVREVETHMSFWGPRKRYESLIFYQIRKEKTSDEEKVLTAAAQEKRPHFCQTYDSWANVMEGLETKLFLGDGDKF